MQVKFNDLYAQWAAIEAEARPALEGLFESSAYINGPAVGEFEKAYADYVGTKHAIGVSSGTDAIKLAVESLGLQGKVGVLLPANTFIATILGVEQALPDAEFVLVDCDDYYQIDTSALETQLELHRDDWDECLLVPVHLYGHSADMIKIMSLAQRHDCKVLEDASQSHGTLCENGKLTGAIGHVAAFSLYPGKNLGALGDAGIVTTNDDEIAKNVSLLRNYGSERKYYYEFKGHNNRLDSMQAIFLKEKLKHLTDWNEARNNVARFYGENIENEKVIKPELASYCKYHVYHIYPVRVGHRDLFMKHLQQNDIQCGIHYPIPIELTKPFSSYGKIYNNEKTRAFAEEIVSLPIHPFMSNEDMSRVCEAINRWK